ncbi:MAG: hypothetical protein DMG65_03630 [Candidatus Angelobacter sp. Gp1-AA117]|nr:MAG: hypothetical protein DMG65_03630 [Candidatus Angelobacter sp. Gp1-AA117]
MGTYRIHRISQDTTSGFPSHTGPGTELLLAQLYACEEQLHAWLDRSEENAAFFTADPVAAMRAANIGMDEEALQELASVLAGIQRKLV